MAKKIEKKNGLVKRAEAGIEERPSWVPKGNAGFEGGSTDDMILPRLAICQSLSPQRKKGNPSFIEELEEGDIFNTVTGQIYQQPVRITPVLIQKSRIKFGATVGAPAECFGRPAQGVGSEGVACQLNNGGPCKYPGFEKSDCKLIMNFPVIVHEAPGDPIVLSLKSASIIVGKKWFTEMKIWKFQGEPVPMFAQQFDVESIERKFQLGAAFQFKITRAVGFPPELVGRSAHEAYKSLKDVAFAPHLPETESGSQEREPGDEVDY